MVKTLSIKLNGKLRLVGFTGENIRDVINYSLIIQLLPLDCKTSSVQWPRSQCLKSVLQSVKTILANSADPDEMSHSVPFYLCQGTHVGKGQWF